MHKLENSIIISSHKSNKSEILHNIEYQQVGQVAYARLNRTEKMNSLKKEMIHTIINYVNQANQNPSIKVIILQGSGNSFCAGQDLSELIDNQNLTVKELLDHYHDKLILAIKKCNKPIIAAINGVAAEAGAIIAIACDLTIAVENSQFTFDFAKIGLPSGSGETHFLIQDIEMQ